MTKFAAENILLIFTILGVFGGLFLGVAFRDPEATWSKRELNYLRFPGDIFVRLLKMLILPLIMSSIISSLSSLDSTTAGRLGTIALAYYFITTMIAIIIGCARHHSYDVNTCNNKTNEGIILVVTIQPGKWITTNVEEILGTSSTTQCISHASDTLLDLVNETYSYIREDFKEKSCSKYMNGSVALPMDLIMTFTEEQRSRYHEVPEVNRSEGMNILGLVVFAVALGITISVIGDEGAPLKAFFKSLEAVSMRLISVVIWLSPVGVIFLIAAQIVSMKDPRQEFQRLMGYMICVLVGLAIHGLIILPTLMLILARRNPFKYVYGMAQALLTAFTTSSSSATLPLSIKCVEENNGVDPRVARFVLPLGATMFNFSISQMQYKLIIYNNYKGSAPDNSCNYNLWM